jgi:hypothetical protein
MSSGDFFRGLFALGFPIFRVAIGLLRKNRSPRVLEATTDARAKSQIPSAPPRAVHHRWAQAYVASVPAFVTQSSFPSDGDAEALLGAWSRDSNGSLLEVWDPSNPKWGPWRSTRLGERRRTLGTSA